MSKKKKTYSLRTIQDMVDVATPKNIELLLNDFALMLHFHMQLKMEGVEFSDAGMEWTDDGNNEITGYNVRFAKPKSEQP